MSIRLPDKELLVKLHLEGELVSCTYLIFSNEGQNRHYKIKVLWPLFTITFLSLKNFSEVQIFCEINFSKSFTKLPSL